MKKKKTNKFIKVVFICFLVFTIVMLSASVGIQSVNKGFSPHGTYSVTENGKYNVEKHKYVEVNVESRAPNLQDITVNGNGEYVASNGYDGIGKVTVNVIPNEIYRIAVSIFPKTEYYVGEEADFSNLKIEVLLNNGKTYFVESSACEISGFDSSTPIERQKITVTHNSHSCNFFVIINELPTPKPILASISLESMPKTNYVLGEWLDTTGGVILLTYSDESVKRVNLMNSDVYGFENCTEAGVYTLIVKYSDGTVMKETTYDITLVEPESTVKTYTVRITDAGSGVPYRIYDGKTVSGIETEWVYDGYVDVTCTPVDDDGAGYLYIKCESGGYFATPTGVVSGTIENVDGDTYSYQIFKVYSDGEIKIWVGVD